VGIARAGVIPGAVIASILRVDFHSMKISRRDGDEQVRDRPAILSAAPGTARGSRVLVVDEIASSGETLRMAQSSLRNVGPAELRSATCFVRPRGYKPDYFALETDATIIFPWDRKIFQDDQLIVNPRYQAVAPGSHSSPRTSRSRRRRLAPSSSLPNPARRSSRLTSRPSTAA